MCHGRFGHLSGRLDRHDLSHPYGDAVPEDLPITTRMYQAISDRGMYNAQGAYQRAMLIAIQRLEAAIVHGHESNNG